MDSEHGQATLSQATEENFESEVLRSQQPVLVAFGAHWSKPCQMLKPLLSEIEERCAGKVRVLAVDADDHPDLSAWYEIESIPTLLCFVEGQVRARIVGFASKRAILSKLDAFTEGLNENNLPTARQ